jgi:hypothetical protein
MRAWGINLAALLAVACGGCVSSQETFTPTGQKGHVINCTPGWTGGIVGAVASANTSWGQCYQRAGEICGTRGFDILQQVGEAGAYAQVGQGGGFASTTNNRTMIIQCKGDGPPPPTPTANR